MREEVGVEAEQEQGEEGCAPAKHLPGAKKERCREEDSEERGHDARGEQCALNAVSCEKALAENEAFLFEGIACVGRGLDVSAQEREGVPHFYEWGNLGVVAEVAALPGQPA